MEEVTLTALGCEVDAERGDGVLGGVPVELCHQQVVVLHAQRELLHIWGGGDKGGLSPWPPPPPKPPRCPWGQQGRVGGQQVTTSDNE